MQNDINLQPIYIKNKRPITFIFALIFLYLGGVMLAEPALAFFMPTDFMPTDARTSEIIAFRTVSIIVALFAGVPFFSISVSLFMRLGRKFLIYSDERGLYAYTDVFPIGFLPWECMESLNYREKLKILEVVLKENAQLKLNVYWRIKSCLCRKRSGKRILTIEFSICKGKSRRNFTKNYRFTKPLCYYR